MWEMANTVMAQRLQARGGGAANLKLREDVGDGKHLDGAPPQLRQTPLVPLHIVSAVVIHVLQGTSKVSVVANFDVCNH